MLALAGALAVAIFVYFDPLATAAQETALRMGLTNIRTALTLYRVREHRFPGDIRELLDRGYFIQTPTAPLAAPAYLQHQSTDDDGFPIDPFGHRFSYDPVNGTVQSTSHPYEAW